ncbi:MAG TPA: MerR family transcriptional regulator [Burkholderiales bacterium]|nr:MerR family transcriptional regulator [Burkholderiales bacterium]
MPDSRVPGSLKIGELASRSGRSVHAIRWYEAQGLIPGVVRDPGGRRRYSERHLDWLALMERLRKTGMSIADMREYTKLVRQGRSTLHERQAMLARHRERVKRTIVDWNEALALLERKLDFYDDLIRRGRSTRGAPSR